MKVLVVEDEIIIRKSLELSIQTAGYNVISGTAYGEKAVEKAVQDKIDVVLMDINLKGEMDGIDAAKEIGRIGNSWIIFLSAYDYKSRVSQENTFHFAGYLSKPIREEVLLKVLRETENRITY